MNLSCEGTDIHHLPDIQPEQSIRDISFEETGRKMNKIASVLYPYSPKNDDELALQVGDKIEVIGVEEEGWWKGSLNGRLGVFPSNFVKVVEAESPTSTTQNISKLNSIFGSRVGSKNSLSSSNSLNNISNSNNNLNIHNNNTSNSNNSNNLIMNNTHPQQPPLHDIDSTNEYLFAPPADGSSHQTNPQSERRPKPLRGIGFGDIFAQGARTKPLPADPITRSSTTTSASERFGANNATSGLDSNTLGRLSSNTLQKPIPKKPPPPAPTENTVGTNGSISDQAPALPPKPSNQFSPLLAQRPPPNPTALHLLLSIVIQTFLLFAYCDKWAIKAVAQDLSYSSNGQQQQEQSYTRPQYGNSNNLFRRERVSWCTTGLLERKKCLDWARAIEEVNIQYEFQEPFKLNLDCAQGADKDQCMSMIDGERADLLLLDPGEIGVAGRYHSLTPIMLERYAGSSPGKVEYGHYSVALVKRRSAASIQSLSDLFGKRACFSGVSHMASWTLPLASLIDLPQFEIADCNNLIKSASYFFGNSCAPNALINKFNPTGDNPQKMSQLCERLNGRAVAQGESHNGAFAALKCLADPVLLSSFNLNDPRAQAESLKSVGADVAFLPHNTIFLAEKLSLSREARLELPSRNELELLCPQGGRAPLDRWQSCNFGFVPAHAITVSSRTSPERREAIQKFLKTSIQLFSGSSSSLAPVSSSQLYQQQISPQNQNSFGRQDAPTNSRSQQHQQQSPLDFPNYLETYTSSSSLNNLLGSSAATTYGKLNTNFKLNGDYALMTYPSLDVIFSSDMVDLVPLTGAGQTFKGFLNSFPVQLATSSNSGSSRAQNDFAYFYSTPKPIGNSVFEIQQQTDYFEKLRRCSVPATVLCVTSDKEFNKCQGMSKAFNAAGLQPQLNCKLAQSTLACMQLIKNRDADLVVLDAADVYLAGSKFGLIPIVSEQVEMQDPHHYAVAVAKKSDASTDLFNLKGKMTCHSGYLKGAGWVMPINFLLSNERMRQYDDCNSARSAAEHFDKACVPGALSSLSNTRNVSSWTIRNLCELCHGTGRGYCARDASEPFFGDTGSFRCLIEGGGQVAFCKHTAIFENTGGSNRETWARNLIRSDFELLCRDGSRAPVSEYKSCNLGRVPPNAIVTRGDTPFRLIDTYVNLFLYGQQYYGSKYSEEYKFKMFYSQNGQDLIFQDATQQLVRVPLANQTYHSYLNHEFLRAFETVFCS